MFVNDLVAVDSAAAMIEPAISSCKSNALTVSDHCAAVTHRLRGVVSIKLQQKNFNEINFRIL